MDSKRSLLFMALLFISFLIYQQWQVDYNTPKPEMTEQAQVSEVNSTALTATSDIANDTQAKGRVITLENDVFRLKVNTFGGDVIGSELLNYDAELHSSAPFVLLQNNADKVYIAQSGLVGKNGIDSRAGRANYQVEGDVFKLAEGQQELKVPLVFEKDGVIYRKVFVLKPGLTH